MQHARVCAHMYSCVQACVHVCVHVRVCTCTTPVSTQYSDEQEQDVLEERPQDPIKQEELVTQQKDMTEKMPHQFDVSEMR